MKNTKKGFTLVELLVVIAIVAILATVAIIGYTSFVKKADESADISAIRQINTVLEASTDKPQTILEVSALLKANGFNVEDGIVPLYEGRSFYWYRPTNQMVYVNEEDGKFELVFPESIEGFPSAKNDDCQTMPTINPDVALTVPSIPADTVFGFASTNINAPANVTVPTLNSFEDTIEWVNTLDNGGNRQTITCQVNGAKKNGILLDSDVKLTEDVVLDLRANASTLNINIAGNVTIDLNGHKFIQKGLDGASIALFTVRAGATLNIVDSSAEKTGAICASYAFQIDAGATVNLYSGSVVIPAPEYQNTADYDESEGRAAQLIFVYGGTFNMYGGKVDATVAEGNIDCAIGNSYASNSATVNLYAGEIVGMVDTSNIPNYNNYGAPITE